MSERQAGYAPRDGDEDGVRVNVHVQAGSEEIEDLVAVIVGRLEDAGLVSAERSRPRFSRSLQANQQCINLEFFVAQWVRE
jgi:hypothetical protein